MVENADKNHCDFAGIDYHKIMSTEADLKKITDSMKIEALKNASSKSRRIIFNWEFVLKSCADNMWNLTAFPRLGDPETACTVQLGIVASIFRAPLRTSKPVTPEGHYEWEWRETI